jgi:hypothetical protein
VFQTPPRLGRAYDKKAAVEVIASA